MAAPPNQVFFPSGFQELFSTWSRFSDAVVCAGGTGFIHTQESRVPVLKSNIISLDKMDELRKISRTERYLEIGALVKLNQIINLGKIVPEALTRCLLRIADPQVRSQASIGGNICFSSHKLDASAPMIALDAQYELRTAQAARWISAARFSSMPGPSALADQELLTRIRVPLEPWSFTWYRKFNAVGNSAANGIEVNGGGSEDRGVILFIMRNQKDILTNIRIVYSGKTILREKNSETMFLGKRLPISRKDAEAFLDRWRNYLSSMEGAENDSHVELTKSRIINFIKTVLRHISD